MFLNFHKTFIPKNKGSHKKVSLKLERGENLNIQGPSGSGKSSYINALLGLPNILNGEIYFKGKNLKKNTSNKWTLIRRYDFSVVLQNLGLFNNLTVEENLQLIVNLYLIKDYKEIDFIKETLNINKYNSKKVKFLSLGEKQRLAICRTLIRPFSLLILDEPFSHLDKDNVSKCIELISYAIKKNNASLLLTSHDKEDRILFDKRVVL